MDTGRLMYLVHKKQTENATLRVYVNEEAKEKKKKKLMQKAESKIDGWRSVGPDDPGFQQLNYSSTFTDPVA
uniref:BCNT-C domain-containing protein n=1 Tax=Syphacia muris TaxID=451379 RepID=A0A0N5AV57_9BILA